MIKIIFLFLVCLCFSGCTVQYDLTIDEHANIVEQIVFQAENVDESEAIQDNSWSIKVNYNDPDLGEYPEKIEGVNYYNDTVYYQNGYYQRQLNYPHTLNTLRNSNMIQSCYEHFYVREDSSSVTLSTSSEFLCMDEYEQLSSVQVRIHLPQNVISSNADEVYGEQYVWNIDRTNYLEKGLILSFEKSGISHDSNPTQEEEEDSVPMVYILLILGLFFVFLIGVFVYNYNQRNHS